MPETWFTVLESPNRSRRSENRAENWPGRDTRPLLKLDVVALTLC